MEVTVRAVSAHCSGRARWPSTLILATAVMVSVAVPGCSAPPLTTSSVPAPPTGWPLPNQHVHGLAINPGDGLPYLATHGGLFRFDAAGPERVGPVLDLMGFTIAGPNRFLASGHPGQGSTMPNPLGLVESSDGGATWVAQSRQGESDFHTLTATAAGVLGFDGVLRTSPDGVGWETVPVDFQPTALIAAPEGEFVIASTDSGQVFRSADAGRTWSALPGAPALAVAAWSNTSVIVGVGLDGSVNVSADAGATWQQRGSARLAALAVTSRWVEGESEAWILVATPQGLVESVDGGISFTALGADD